MAICSTDRTVQCADERRRKLLESYKLSSGTVEIFLVCRSGAAKLFSPTGIPTAAGPRALVSDVSDSDALEISVSIHLQGNV